MDLNDGKKRSIKYETKKHWKSIQSIKVLQNNSIVFHSIL